ncbi:KRFJ protein, partial [Phainopepla nitens]|nr:KRFJ protein [Phainopepla nitens]
MCSELPAASGSGRPCSVRCSASRVLIFPPPVLITFPGPVLSTCVQETVLGSTGMGLGSAGSTGLGSAETGLGSAGSMGL